MKILLTGSTGFLGSHIADLLSRCGHELLLTARKNSSRNNCHGFENRVTWLDVTDPLWINEAIAHRPDVIVHGAWSGVASKDRDCPQSQFSNLSMLTELLHIARICKVSKFIGLGSQAEYGLTEGVISEEQQAVPSTLYGSIKLAALYQLKTFCSLNDIPWYWLRVFSVCGERESGNWLLPAVICRMLRNEAPVELTEGKQSFAYLYVKDFAEAVGSVVAKEAAQPGIYNISSADIHPLRYYIDMVRDRINPRFEINYGAIPYRDNQPLVIAGDPSKFTSEFGHFERTPFQEAIEKIIDYYRHIA